MVCTDFGCCETAVSRDAVKSECDDTVSVPTDKAVHSDSAALTATTQQSSAGVPPGKRPR